MKTELIFLGTGHAMTKERYNTCFVIKDRYGAFLVDGGGGNGLLRQLDRADIPVSKIRDIFITHKHMDHIMGIFWILRYYAHHTGQVRIYSHRDVIVTLRVVAAALFTPKQFQRIEESVELIPVEDGDWAEILGHDVEFFDLHSSKERQFGFKMDIGGGLVCLGDEPCSGNEGYVEDAEWLLHEAFCLESEADVFKPYEKHHSTVRDAARFAEEQGVENLILYHTEESHGDERVRLYLKEGEEFSGNLYVPEDLERIVLEE